MDVSVLGVARSELAELGLRLDQAINEYTDARRRLGEIALSEAVNCYLNHHPLGIRKISLEELVKRFLDYKQDSGVSDAYLKDLEFRLRSLIAVFSFSPESGYFGLIQILAPVDIYRIKPACLAPPPECGGGYACGLDE